MFAAYTYYATGLPDPNILDDFEPAESTYVYDRTGQTLLARFECQNREAVNFAELPDVVWQATVASEDRTYWDNNGVDYPGDGPGGPRQPRGRRDRPGRFDDHPAGHRLCPCPAGTGRVHPGGSGRQPGSQCRGGEPGRTGHRGERSEQQADVCQPPEPAQSSNFEDKIRENILAMQVTAAYPGREGKEKILETYLNLIYYGNGSYGIRAAAANYFGITDLAELSRFAGRLPGRAAPTSVVLRPVPEPER